MRVNMDSSVASDPRFKLVAAALGVKWTEVVGSSFLLWLACYERRSERLRKVEADVAAELSGFADALVAEGLADDCGDGTIVVHGVTERIEFLKRQAERGAKGGKSKKKPGAQANAKQTLVQTLSTDSQSAQANTLTLTPALSHTPTQIIDSAQAAPERVQSEVTRAELEAVYAGYPRKQGKERGLTAAVKAIRTRDEFETFRACVEHMSRVYRTKDARQFCPHFSTFVNARSWRDEEWPGAEKLSAPRGQLTPGQMLDQANGASYDI